MPYRGEVIHARWSGESIWSPLSSIWPLHSVLPQESSSGPLQGNVVLTLDHRHARLVELGREILWRAALPVRIG
jgi:hypothetical protein